MLSKHFLFFFLANLILLSSASTGVVAQTGSAVYAGVAQVNITPPFGYSHYRGVSTGVSDSLYAKAIVFGKGNQRFALVSCDLLWIERGLSSKVRQLVSKETGIAYSNMIIAGTHSHTSPSYHLDIDELNQDLRPASYVAPKSANGEEYPNLLVKLISQAIINADRASMLVNIEAGTANVHGLSFNRRQVLKDGTVRTNSGIGNPDIIGTAGPVDSAIGIIMLRRASDNRPIGCLTNFGLHADTFGGTKFGADYPGFLASNLRSQFGEDFVSIFATGACGDINHVNVHGPKKNPSSQQIGDQLAAVIKKAIPSLKKVRNPRPGANSEFVYAPLQHYSEKELAWAMSKDIDSIYKESAFLTRRRSVKIKSLHRMRSSGEAIPPTIGSGPWTIPLEIQVFRVSDDVAIVGLPGELFTELSMEIKRASPFKTTLVVELTNSHIAYVPTEKAFAEGSYETINSRLAPGGGEMMVNSAIGLLKSIYKPERN